jgi:hypothetical protein
VACKNVICRLDAEMERKRVLVFINERKLVAGSRHSLFLTASSLLSRASASGAGEFLDRAVVLSGKTFIFETVRRIA